MRVDPLFFAAKTMRPLLQEIQTLHSPESLVESLAGETGVVLLRTTQFDLPSSRYSFVSASPLLTFRSFGSRCEITHHHGPRITHHVQFGNPWHLLDALMARCELLDEIDLPFPLGGAFGYWGYDLKNFSEPKLPRRAVNDLELPDCQVGFYDSLVVFDHQSGKVIVVSTGLNADGSRNEARARERLEFWKNQLIQEARGAPGQAGCSRLQPQASGGQDPACHISSNLTREQFIAAVERAQRYIRSGDIYQVNLAQRLTADIYAEHRAPGRPVETIERAGPEAGASVMSGWNLFKKLSAVSPAPFSAYLNGGDFEIASSSPEQFLRVSGSHIVTRPIKGTRPRGADPTRDAELAGELQSSAKERAELVMITDLLRNDLGRVCAYGSVRTPELARLERFAQVQHLVSTVEGRLRPDVTHFAAFATCFPGGSITGAPKFRAMEIIDELEPVSRGPYCGAIGYLGFNRESQLNIAIRTAICLREKIHFHVGAGIVADSSPAAEYEETLAKARGFFVALGGDDFQIGTSKFGGPTT
jgi:para-aminobenzoate synthetase component 1